MGEPPGFSVGHGVIVGNGVCATLPGGPAITVISPYVNVVGNKVPFWEVNCTFVKVRAERPMLARPRRLILKRRPSPDLAGLAPICVIAK